MGHGAYCSDAGYRACEYTMGPHGVMHPDFRYTKYLLAWGWNITSAGGNKFCWLTWPQQLIQAREKGIKQFVDIGSGLPTMGNTHEIVQEIHPRGKVVYVDCDAEAVEASRILLKGNKNATDRSFLKASLTSSSIIRS